MTSLLSDSATMDDLALVTLLFPYRERGIMMSVGYLRVSVCLSAIISQEPDVHSLPIFLCLLRMAVSRSSSGGVTISYILPVLWMTS